MVQISTQTTPTAPEAPQVTPVQPPQFAAIQMQNFNGMPTFVPFRYPMVQQPIMMPQYMQPVLPQQYATPPVVTPQQSNLYPAVGKQ